MGVITVKLEDFDALVKDGQLDTESIIKIRDSINEQNTTIETMQKDIEAKNARISELQETNGKLYLRITGNPSSDSEVVSTPSVDDIIKNWGKL